MDPIKRRASNPVLSQTECAINQPISRDGTVIGIVLDVQAHEGETPSEETSQIPLLLERSIVNKLFLPRNDKARRQVELNRYGFVVGDEKWAGLDVRNRDIITRSLNHTLSSLLPPPDFTTQRENAKQSIADRLFEKCAEMGIEGLEDAQLHLFGSSRNGFGSVSADLDINLRIKGEISNNKKIRLCESLGLALTACGMHRVEVRSRARVPIVLFEDPVSGLSCDIALGNNLAVHNTYLLHTYSEIDVRVRELVYLVKYWAKQRDINTPSNGSLSSYGYALMVIHFLQTLPVPVLPNLQTLPPNYRPHSSQTNNNKSQYDKQPLRVDESGRFNVYFYQPGSEQAWRDLKSFSSPNRTPTPDLLIAFFKYYGMHFAYHREVVSVRSNGLGWDSVGPNKVDKAESDAWVKHDRLSIEDPFETFYDVAHVIRAEQMGDIQREFLRAYTLATRLEKTVDDTRSDLTAPYDIVKTDTAAVDKATTPVEEGDDLHPAVRPSEFVDILCRRVKKEYVFVR
eukprot:gene22509-28638_t